MPAGQGKDAEERFAAAVESRSPLAAADDADLARELEIVAMLRSRGAAFAPDADTKARAKQRLMAVLAAEQGGPRQAPRAVPAQAEAELTAPLGRLAERTDVDPAAETALIEPIRADLAPDSETDDAGTLAEPIPLHGGKRAGRGARHSLGGRSRRPVLAGLRGRVVFVGAAAAAALLAIASGGVLASSNALPGDTLYPVKRVAESAGLALTFDEADRARRHLEIAATRLSEVEQLAHDSQAAPAPEVFTEAMDDFDSATNEGSQLLLSTAATDNGGTAAEDLHKWATEQSNRLAELEPELPPSADAGTSKQLLQRLLGQTGGLETDSDASRRTADESDGGSGSEDATEDPTTTKDKKDSSDANETDEPSRSSEKSTERENPRLLPDLSPNTNRDEDEKSTGSASEDEDSGSTSESDSDEGGDGNVSVPLPLLPPVTLPPLLPGMPGITIG
ncbi:DUF5667 domain-containing protein [Pseudonocardia cypriaca]|uniref:DUF5667 domain-containing protein n=1 Tax=Pseudonocardia cypriaca TaxID=882449 RepID=A0A543FNU0_9PSEU|nr:DUF5667 domain-containing protein [Pseudonocardia cypriaca]TQM35446.1 hypothetical protein FB388_6879 [Pseudonocardia cypriaca]